MIKVVFSWNDRPDLTGDECEGRYRAGHMPMARAAFEGVPGFRMLRYNRVRRATVNDYNQRAPRTVDPDIDAWVELYFDSEEQLQAAFTRPHLQDLFDDHPNFMDCEKPANIHVYWVDEDVILAGPQPQPDLQRALRTTGAVRAFRDEPVARDTLRRILDTARFAPSGGNKQSWRVISVEDPATRARLHALTLETAKEYLALNATGQRAFGLTANGRWPGPGDVDLAAARRGPDPEFFAAFEQAPAVLVICSELGLIAAMDAELDRHGIVPGASVYPFCWSVLLAARLEGMGGVMTTFAARREPEVLALLGAPEGLAVVAVIYVGYPVKQATKLTRRPVDDFACIDRFGGPPL